MSEQVFNYQATSAHFTGGVFRVPLDSRTMGRGSIWTYLPSISGPAGWALSWRPNVANYMIQELRLKHVGGTLIIDPIGLDSYLQVSEQRAELSVRVGNRSEVQPWSNTIPFVKVGFDLPWTQLVFDNSSYLEVVPVIVIRDLLQIRVDGIVRQLTLVEACQIQFRPYTESQYTGLNFTVWGQSSWSGMYLWSGNSGATLDTYNSAVSAYLVSESRLDTFTFGSITVNAELYHNGGGVYLYPINGPIFGRIAVSPNVPTQVRVWYRPSAKKCISTVC